MTDCPRPAAGKSESTDDLKKRAAAIRGEIVSGRMSSFASFVSLVVPDQHPSWRQDRRSATKNTKSTKEQMRGNRLNWIGDLRD
jgi:hypothetical protein